MFYEHFYVDDTGGKHHLSLHTYKVSFNNGEICLEPPLISLKVSEEFGLRNLSFVHCQVDFLAGVMDQIVLGCR